jgi:hypothetical protein
MADTWASVKDTDPQWLCPLPRSPLCSKILAGKTLRGGRYLAYGFGMC